MTTQPKSPQGKTPPSVAPGILARASQIVVVFALQAAILFLAAGRADWLWAWVFLGIYVASVATNSVFMLRTSAETIAERGRPKEMKNWDKLVSALWSLAQFLLIPLVAGLDVRFGLSGGMGAGIHIAGGIVFAAGLAVFGWAMITNAFFSTVVRIQEERGQTVCREGPYRFVRHPGYVGTLLQSAGAPLLLGSWWALLPGMAAAAFMIIRTSLEDRTLRAELAGYSEFAEEVRYRLVPGIW
jgi:protein-S-isoprenylcysteine O-methyltransferase Ste14